MPLTIRTARNAAVIAALGDYPLARGIVEAPLSGDH